MAPLTGTGNMNADTETHMSLGGAARTEHDWRCIYSALPERSKLPPTRHIQQCIHREQKSCIVHTSSHRPNLHNQSATLPLSYYYAIVDESGATQPRLMHGRVIGFLTGCFVLVGQCLSYKCTFLFYPWWQCHYAQLYDVVTS